MTPAESLYDFQKRTGIDVRASPVGPDLLLVLTARESAAVLAVIYDLSDSCTTAARLAARLPGLLRGWDRATTVWAYALGDERPISSFPAGTVGHVLDGSLDLLAPTADTALLAERRYRGSFIGPTLNALRRRAASENVRNLRVALIGDGRLTDFGPTPTGDADLIGIIDHDTDSPSIRPRWTAVVGSVPLLPMADAQVPGWFASRATPTSSAFSLRVSGDDVRRLDLSNTSESIVDAAFDWYPQREPLRLLVPRAATDFQMECRSKRDATILSMASIHAATPVDGDAVRSISARLNTPAPSGGSILYDSRTSSADAATAWQFAADVASRAADHQSWPAWPMRTQPQAANGPPLVAVCFASRPPQLPMQPDDRVVILAVTSRAAGLTLAQGVGVPMGAPTQSWRFRYDSFEDRWRLSIAPSNPAAADAAELELHPTGSQLLPVLRTAATTWTAVYSGPLRAVSAPL